MSIYNKEFLSINIENGIGELIIIHYFYDKFLTNLLRYVINIMKIINKLIKTLLIIHVGGRKKIFFQRITNKVTMKNGQHLNFSQINFIKYEKIKTNKRKMVNYFNS